MHAWLDLSAGVAGDTLLGALLDAGAPLADVRAAVDAAVPDTVVLQVSPVYRAGLRASTSAQRSGGAQSAAAAGRPGRPEAMAWERRRTCRAGGPRAGRRAGSRTRRRRRGRGPVVVGIDMGTGSTQGVLTTVDGEVVATGVRRC